MHLPCLHAVVPKPAAAAGAAGWNLLPLGSPLQPGGGPFAFGLGPQTLPSAMQPGVNVYSEVPVPPASLLWDAITVGYGWVSDLLAYIGAPWIAAAVRRHAATRAQMIRANLIFPSGAILGPIRSPTVYHLDMSEKVLLSYLTGQMIAQRLAKRCWGVNRLLHRSLYGPFIPALTGGALGALGPGQSPDYICFGNLGGGGVGLGLVEAKGTQDNFNPRLVAKNRERINHAFSEQIAPTVGGLGAGGAWNCGVSVACADAALDPDLVVGQFWDPPNPEATRIANEVVEDLTRRYFQSMHFLLTSLGRPVKVQANEQLLWRSREVGFEVRISARQWDWMSDLSEDNLVQGRVVQLAQELPPEKESDVDGVPNGDGLILKLMS